MKHRSSFPLKKKSLIGLIFYRHLNTNPNFYTFIQIMGKVILLGHSHLDRLQDFRDCHQDTIPFHVNFSRGGLCLNHLTGPIKPHWDNSKKLAFHQFNKCLELEAKESDSICFFIGDNDIGKGKSAEEVATGLFAFGTLLKKTLLFKICHVSSALSSL